MEEITAADDDQFSKKFHAGGDEKISEGSPPPLKKQKLDEERDSTEKEEENDDDYYDEEMDTRDYDSDRHCRNELLTLYRREIRQSQGFDIDHYPGDSCMDADIVPLYVEKCRVHPAYLTDCPKAAIEVYNRNKKTNYKFEKVERANSQLYGAGVNFFLTIQAKDYTADAVKTFQAKVWWDFMNEAVLVKFCRLKRSPAAT